jgi:hypothetical protein
MLKKTYSHGFLHHLRSKLSMIYCFERSKSCEVHHVTHCGTIYVKKHAEIRSKLIQQTKLGRTALFLLLKCLMGGFPKCGIQYFTI